MRRVRRTTGALGLIVTLALLVVGTGSPAHAERWSVSDGDNRAMSYGDVSRVWVDHAPRRVFAKVSYHQRAVGDSVTLYFDTRRGDQGPEFALTLALDDTYGVLGRRLDRVERFGRGGESVRCRGLHTLVTKRDAVWVDVPRRCLATGGTVPGRVRLSVHSVATYDGDDSSTRRFDWAPARHRFGPWVAR